MKLIRFGNEGHEKPGIIVNDTWYDVSGVVTDYNEAFFANNDIKKLQDALAAGTSFPVVEPTTRLGSVVARPSKIICIGLNYVDHCLETNAPIPTEPVLFFKSTTALCGPNDHVVIPKNSVKTDWEVELAFVIGKKASYVEESEALDYVAGYCLHNDYSEREFQLERGGQWAKGKGCDTFAPLGPFLATPDEIADVNNLKMWLTVNGKTYQNSNTLNLVFKIPFLVHYLSQFMTLLPGDVISTGTPPGVGLGIKPEPVYVKAGDVIELGIEGLGTSKQTAVAYTKNKSMAAQQYFLALDLKEDPALIAEYKAYHQNVWPEIIESIKSSGITCLDIYCVSNRLFMVLEANENFSFEAKSATDAVNEVVQKWETLMWTYQQAMPGSKPGEKWVLLEKIFTLPQ